MSEYRLAVMAAPAVLGEVLPRLAEEAGDAAALKIYRNLLRRTAEVLWQLPGAIAPSIAWSKQPVHDDFFRPHRYMIQPTAAAPVRYARVLNRILAPGVERAALLEVTTPALSAEDVVEAYRRLDQADLVLGPATSGGYYLLAARRFVPSLFPEDDPPRREWLSFAIQAARQEGLSVELLDVKHDIITHEDWRRTQVRGKHG